LEDNYDSILGEVIKIYDRNDEFMKYWIIHVMLKHMMLLVHLIY